MLSQSMGNLSDLKSIKVRMTPTTTASESRRFRKVEERDMVLLNFLGIKIGK